MRERVSNAYQYIPRNDEKQKEKLLLVDHNSGHLTRLARRINLRSRTRTRSTLLLLLLLLRRRSISSLSAPSKRRSKSLCTESESACLFDDGLVDWLGGAVDFDDVLYWIVRVRG